MLYDHSKSIQRIAHQNFLKANLDHFERPFSLTITFIGSESVIIEKMEGRFLRMVHRLSKQYKPNQYRRKKELIRYIAVKEYDVTTRPHLHAVFDLPEKAEEKEFLDIIRRNDYLFDVRGVNAKKVRRPKIVQSKWTTAEWANNYLTKKRTKEVELKDSIIY